jgi:hypothetical protein
MSLDLRAALRYPFMGNNWLQGWIIPSLIVLTTQMIAVTTGYLLQLAQPDITADAIYYFFIPFVVFINVSLAGFLWHMTREIQVSGERAPLLRWSQHVFSFLKAGSKLFLYFFLINLVIKGLHNLIALVLPDPTVSALVLAGCVVLLAPVLLAPIMQSAQGFRLLDLFNLSKASSWLWMQYGRGLRAGGLSALIFLLYGGVIYFLLGFAWGAFLLPFAILPMLVSIWHLMSQALDPMAPLKQL